MMVYVVLLEGAYGVTIEKIFTSQTKAEEYKVELKKQDSYSFFRVEAHWAI